MKTKMDAVAGWEEESHRKPVPGASLAKVLRIHQHLREAAEAWAPVNGGPEKLRSTVTSLEVSGDLKSLVTLYDLDLGKGFPIIAPQPLIINYSRMSQPPLPI